MSRQESRFNPLTPEQMTADQTRLAAEIAGGPRGSVTLPFQALIQAPDIATHAHRLGEVVRYKISIPEKLRELAILVTARHWTAQYEWYAHRKLAQRAGLADAIIDAIALRRRPHFDNDDERLIHDFATAVTERHKVSDELYNATVARFGVPGVVELIGLLGYYGLISMTLNIFEVAIPGGEAPPLKD